MQAEANNFLSLVKGTAKFVAYAVLSVVALIVVLIGVLVALSWFDYNYLRPEFTKDLPTNTGAAEAEFNARIVTRFPLGSLEEELIKAVRKQGFKVKRNQGVATYETLLQGPVCNRKWAIVWQKNQAGQLTYIQGDDRSVCF